MEEEQPTLPPLHIPGFGGGGGSHTSKVKAYVATPPGSTDAVIVSFTEEGNDILAHEIEQLGTFRAEEYGLDDPPGHGIWVFEGELRVTWHRCGHPLDPPDYDTDMHWEGEWRALTQDELNRLNACRPVLEKKEGPE